MWTVEIIKLFLVREAFFIVTLSLSYELVMVIIRRCVMDKK